jgi:hypothetical protein
VDTITLKEVLQMMDNGHRFSISFITADKHKKKGGEWITIADAFKGHERTPQQKISAAASQPKTALLKHPHHFENSTRNIHLPNGEVRKVHIRLIRRFNGLIRNIMDAINNVEIIDGIGFGSRSGAIFKALGLPGYGAEGTQPATPPVLPYLSSSVWSFWGDDNLLPVTLADHIENCGVLSAAFRCKGTHCCWQRC